MKALDDLTQALKERRNKKGMEEMDALQWIDELLNKIPAKPTPTPTQSKRVTFEATAKPPQELQPTAPRVVSEMPTPRVVNKTPTPRVAIETPTPRVSITRQQR